jgi:phenylpyruvate tautomerase PptA (4-oxalocrotonate tautomerase family)
MPLVRISHLAGKPDAAVAAIGEAVHRAMVEHFDVPPDDRFQVLTAHEAGRLVAAPEFLGLRHTADVVFVQITCAEGRSVEKKKALYAALARGVASAAALRPEDVIVNLVETRRENWSFGNGLAPFAS